MAICGVRSHTYLIPHNTSIGRVGWAPWRLAPTGLVDPTARLAACHLLRWRTGISDHETIADIECHNVKVARVVAEYWHRQGWGKCTPFQPDKTRNRHVPGPVPVDQTPDRPARRIARWQVETTEKGCRTSGSSRDAGRETGALRFCDLQAGEIRDDLGPWRHKAMGARIRVPVTTAYGAADGLDEQHRSDGAVAP